MESEEINELRKQAMKVEKEACILVADIQRLLIDS